MDATARQRHRASAQYRPPRLTQTATAFVFSLCVPYIAAASPLPAPAPGGPESHPFVYEAPMRALEHVVLSAGRVVTRLYRRHPSHPTIAIASVDPDGYVRMPHDYVALIQRFNGGFIILSYIIALVGSMCTLELLIRRTTNSGWRNQVLLLSAGLTFGAVSTFSMHFIFNNSLTLHHPLEERRDYPALYLSYEPGYTVLSLVATCCAMTIAFFIMGTTPSDWPCLPSTRRKRARRRSSQSVGADEYGRWKSAQRQVIRRGTVRVGALMNQASSAAKWSLMPGSHGEENGWSRTPKSGKAEKTAGVDDEEDMIRHENELRDLDFRLGRSAVKLALERRYGSTSTVSHETPPHPEQRPLRRMSSIGSLPQHPSPVWIAPSSSRRGSAIDPGTSTASDVFAPGFSFPSRIDTDSASSITNLLPSAPPFATLSPPPLSLDVPPNPLVHDFSGRRASMPAVGLATVRSEAASYRSALTLSRIQSLPEPDADSPKLPSRIGSREQKLASPPTLSVTAKLDTIQSHEEHPDPIMSPKQVRGVDSQVNKLEKFLGFDVVTRSDIVKVFITGTIAGFGVAAMHYIGQLSITGMPYIAYKPPYVVGSVVIASGAVVIALYIMFIMLRPKLKHNWVSKVIVAVILSLAVTAMHFCGMMGTVYGWPRGEPITSHNILTGTNRAITGIVAALAFVACLGCITFFVFHSLRLRKERARRRRVVVAAVFLDVNDRILVNSTDGLLPMCDIASLAGTTEGTSSRKSIRSFSQSFSSDSTVLGIDLTTGHDAFISALKMSWSWRNPNLAPISEAERPGAITLSSTLADIRRGSMTTLESGVDGSRKFKLSVTKFLERFAISSGQLANRLIGTQNGISRLGVLYDQILTTGWVKLNKSNDTVSKGQLIFLVRRIASAAERDDLAANFIFADASAVAASLHKTLSVPLEHTVPLLKDIRVWCDATFHDALKPRTLYAGVAVVQATPFDGLRILLEHNNRTRLPVRELCSFGTTTGASATELSGTVEEIGEALTWLDGMTLLSVIARNMTVEPNPIGGARVANLLAALERAVVPMLDEMLTADDMAHVLPRLTLHPVIVPLLPGSQGPHVIMFYANYDAAVNTFTDKWLPFSLFRVQNACVMAAKIQAALRMEPLLYPAVTSVRRPSKVQFEFPGQNQGQGSSQTQGQGQGQGQGQEDGDAGGAGAASGAISPTARSHSSDTSTPNGAPGSASGSFRSSVPRRSSIARTQRFGSIDKYAERDVESPAQAPPGSTLPLGNAMLQSPIHTVPFSAAIQETSPLREKEGVPGVAEWEAEWLLLLLRNKLHAEA